MKNRSKKKTPKNKSENWVECILELPEPLKDSVTNRLFEIGARGVREADSAVSAFFLSGDKKWEPLLKKYLTSLKALYPELSDLTFETKSVENEDWKDKYKQYFTAQMISKRFYLLPEWESPPLLDNDIFCLKMDPGQAFGTGTHPSTQMCLRLLENSANIINNPRVLDVGTGTGILSIAASKLGAPFVQAIDNDPVAVAVAMENAEKNGVSGFFSETPLEKIDDKFNIIVSNILLETHLQLAPHYVRNQARMGELILSGLIKNQEPQIHSILKSLGYVFDASLVVQEWLAVRYVLVR